MQDCTAEGDASFFSVGFLRSQILHEPFVWTSMAKPEWHSIYLPLATLNQLSSPSIRYSHRNSSSSIPCATHVCISHYGAYGRERSPVWPSFPSCTLSRYWYLDPHFHTPSPCPTFLESFALRKAIKAHVIQSYRCSILCVYPCIHHRGPLEPRS